MFHFKKLLISFALFTIAVSSFASPREYYNLVCVQTGPAAASAYYGSIEETYPLVTTQVVSNDAKDFIQKSCVTNPNPDPEVLEVHDAHDHMLLCKVEFDTADAVVSSGTDYCSAWIDARSGNVQVSVLK